MSAPERIWEFDRYINGVLMADGVTIERQPDLPSAMVAAARLASRGPHGEVPVLIVRATPSALAQAPEVQALIQAAVERERERCAGLADAQERQAKKRSDEADDETQTDFDAGVLFGTEIGARVIAAAIRATPDAPASADAGRAG